MIKRPKQTRVKVFDLAGSFAEDKDVAREIRVSSIKPALQRGDRIVLDFKKVGVSTQSFIHAMISEAILNQGERALRLLEFKSCNHTVKNVILTVVDYCLEMKRDSAAEAIKNGRVAKRRGKASH